MAKYQDLKNKVKRSWNLKNAKVVPVIVGASGMMMRRRRLGPYSVQSVGAA